MIESNFAETLIVGMLDALVSADGKDPVLFQNDGCRWKGKSGAAPAAMVPVVWTGSGKNKLGT